MNGSQSRIDCRMILRNKLILWSAPLLITLIPWFSVELVPEWRLQVVDQTGDVVSDEMIRQTWKDYSLEFWTTSGHEETKTTDKNGFVTFSARSIRVSLVEVIASSIRDTVARMNPHSSYGTSSTVFCVNRINCEAYFRQGEQLPESIVIGDSNK